MKASESHGFEIADGDKWDESPKLTFFFGAVNQAALQPVISKFEEREGVKVNVVFDGCGK